MVTEEGGSSPRVGSEQPARMHRKRCVHCRAEIEPDALLCGSCHNYQVPRWLARCFASPLLALLRFIFAGLLLWMVSQLYQRTDSIARDRMERALTLSRNSMNIQVLAEQVVRPCMLASEADCSKRFQELVRDFSANTYSFKEEAKHIFGGSPDASIRRAIAFLDEFYNPGSAEFGELLAMPLQVELLRSHGVLSTPLPITPTDGPGGRAPTSSRWCSTEARQQLRSLMLSTDVYRYCYAVVRQYAMEFCDRGVFSFGGIFDVGLPIEQAPAFKNCAANVPLVTKVNTIAKEVQSLGPDYSAPWNYDSFCGTSPHATIQGALIPPRTRQLVVVTTKGWDSTSGRLMTFERDGVGPWHAKMGHTSVEVGTNGLAWGRGLHPFPGIALQPQTLLKVESDLRSPAGLFRLGPIYSEHPLANISRMDVRLTNERMVCDDRQDSPQYNSAVQMNPEELTQCEALGQCPEYLKRKDGKYREFVWVHHNAAPVVPGAGSCIFLHSRGGENGTTAGCTAMDEGDLLQLISWLNAKDEPLLVQLPEVEYERRLDAWGLPALPSP